MAKISYIIRCPRCGKQIGPSFPIFPSNLDYASIGAVLIQEAKTGKRYAVHKECLNKRNDGTERKTD